MTRRDLRGAGEIAVERDGDVFVAAHAILDRLGIFLAVDERLPRVNMLRLVEVAVRNERQPRIARAAQGGKNLCVSGHDFSTKDEYRQNVDEFPFIPAIRLI